MAVKIGHASIDENNRVKGGAAGDQTLKEVCTRSWYNKPWACVIRPKDSAAAEKIATAMEQACANNKIGYDQAQRTTLYTQAKAVGWDISKISTACECDCSSLVAVCVNAAGITVSRDIYTGNEKTSLMNTGAFELLTDSKHLSKADHLKRGDILLGAGHTAIVLTDGGGVSEPVTENKTNDTAAVTKKATESAQSFAMSVAGTYKVTASWLNVRNGAGAAKPKIIAIPKGTKVKCYGYYTPVMSTNWLYIQFTYNGVTYTGFASSKYLAKI